MTDGLAVHRAEWAGVTAVPDAGRTAVSDRRTPDTVRIRHRAIVNMEIL